MIILVSLLSRHLLGLKILLPICRHRNKHTCIFPEICPRAIEMHIFLHVRSETIFCITRYRITETATMIKRALLQIRVIYLLSSSDVLEIFFIFLIFYKWQLLTFAVRASQNSFLKSSNHTSVKLNYKLNCKLTTKLISYNIRVPRNPESDRTSNYQQI